MAGLATVLVSECFPKSGITAVTFSLRAESVSSLAGATLRDSETELSLCCLSSLGEQQQEEEESHSQPSQELLHPSESIRDFLVGLVE